MLSDIRAIAVQHQDRSPREPDAKRRVKLSIIDDRYVFPEEYWLGREEREGDERTGKVKVVDVRRDAVTCHMKVHAWERGVGGGGVGGVLLSEAEVRR